MGHCPPLEFFGKGIEKRGGKWGKEGKMTEMFTFKMLGILKTCEGE